MINLGIFTHESCTPSAEVISAYCVEMSAAVNTPDFNEYLLPQDIMTANDVMNVYIAVMSGSTLSVVKVPETNWHIQDVQTVYIDTIPVGAAYLHNRVIFVPKNAFNLCFTGSVNVNTQAARPFWFKRTTQSHFYAYLTLTSIDYTGKIGDILEFPGVSFADGVGTGFTNLTSDYVGAYVDYGGQYLGGVIEVTAIDTLSTDSLYTSEGSSRAFVYNRGTLEFALDVNGAPGSWTRHLSLPIIDNNIPLKVWVRDFCRVTAELTVVPTMAMRVLGTEFNV